MSLQFMVLIRNVLQAAIMIERKLQTQIRSLYTRHGRKKYNLCVCEGLRSCRELFAATPEKVLEVLVCPELKRELKFPANARIHEVKDSELATLSATVNTQGILAVAQIPESPEQITTTDPFIFAVDRLADPGNMGTIIRTLRAVGVQELWYTAGSVDPYADKVIRSALGAQFSLVLRVFKDLSTLLDTARLHGYENFFPTMPGAGENCFECEGLFDKSVIIIGNEANGLPQDTPGTPVNIPMPGEFESLNAAQAATVLLFEYVRRGVVDGKF